jgi:hypothetical protein
MGYPPETSVSRPPRQKLTIIYSNKNRPFLERFRIHLKPLCGLSLWDDSRISPNDTWLDEFAKELKESQVALLLVSPDLIASDFFHSEEISQLFEAEEKEGLQIFWVPLLPCMWKRCPQIVQRQSLIPVDRTLAELSEVERDRAMVEMADKIIDLFERLKKEQIAVEEANRQNLLSQTILKPLAQPGRITEKSHDEAIPLRIFLSYTAELRNYPMKSLSYVYFAEQAVAAAGHCIVNNTDFTASSNILSRVCEQEVRKADVYVAIIGFRYGSPVHDQPTKSYTELEFDTATRQGMPRILFLLDENSCELNLPPQAIYDGENGDRQAEFRKRLKNSGITISFLRNPNQLMQELPQFLLSIVNSKKALLPSVPTTQVIKIFLASSSELEDDRNSFELYLRQENDRMRKQGIYLEVFRWENFLDAMSESRLQDEYNKAIKRCDIFVSLFKTKTGKYTEEEFDVAHATFKDSGKPLIYTYFMRTEVPNDRRLRVALNSLWDFQEKLSELGHFNTEYTNLQDLQLQFRRQLDKLLEEKKF